MQQIADRVKETSTTTGTGPFTLAGAATGYRAFSSICSVSDTFYYVIEGVNVDGTLTGEWEVGFGTYSGANQLTRTSVLASSNANAAVSFSAGSKQVWIDVAATQVSGFAQLAGASFTGEVGIKATAVTTAALTIGTPSSAGTAIQGVNEDITAPATATSALVGFKSALRTAAAAFTLAAMTHFSANAASIGAGSAVTTLKGFEAANAAAVGVTNYAYWTDFAAAANKYAFYGAGTAASFLGGELGVLKTPNTQYSVYVGAPTSAGTALRGVHVDYAGPSTATAVISGFHSNLASAAAAYTLGALVHFGANATVKGAGSTISNVYGFLASNSIIVGTTNYGFYSDIAAAASTWQLHMGGTAPSYFGGAVGILDLSPLSSSSALLSLAAAGVHPGTSTSTFGISCDYTAPSTATNVARGVYSVVRTVAAAFTVGNVNMFEANASKGAGSTITAVRGFYANNALAVGTSNYGFFSDIASGANTWQIYMGGTGQSYFNGPIGIRTTDALGVGVLIYIGGANSHPGTNTSIHGAFTAYTAVTTATTLQAGFASSLSTPNSAYTVTDVMHFLAQASSKGAASTITNVKGFAALNAIAVGTNNYGFYSDINIATNTWQLFMGGNAQSHINGNVLINTTTLQGGIDTSVLGSVPIGTQTSQRIFTASGAFPSTSTNQGISFLSLATTAAAAYTVTNLVHFYAFGAAKGAGSTVTTYTGFWADNNGAVGATNIGFFSNINAAANTYQLHMSGSAASKFAGAVGVKSQNGNIPSPDISYLEIGDQSADHASTLTTAVGVSLGLRAGAGHTANLHGFTSSLRTNAAAFTLGNMNHYVALSGTLGAGSAITNVRGFYAANAIVVGTSNFGFYSDIAAAANTYQLFMGGTGRSAFGGPVYHAQDNNTTQAVSALFQAPACRTTPTAITATSTCVGTRRVLRISGSM
jgi:hypothetical protein